MGLLGKIIILILVVLLVLTFTPVGVLGQDKFNVEVTARLNQQKVQFWNPYTIDNVKYRVVGETHFLEWGELYSTTGEVRVMSALDYIVETGELKFCIYDVCQTNSETFWISPGEQVTTSETIHGIVKGDHTLRITFTVDETVKASFQEVITI